MYKDVLLADLRFHTGRENSTDIPAMFAEFFMTQDTLTKLAGPTVVETEESLDLLDALIANSKPAAGFGDTTEEPTTHKEYDIVSMADATTEEG